MRHVPLIAMTLGLTAAACSGAVPGDPPTAAARASDSAPSVDEILRQMNERYASAKTYSDEGTLHTKLGRGDFKTEGTAKIRTEWSAPKSLHFEFRRDDRLAIWSRDGVTKSAFLGKTIQERSLDDALVAMRGVSQGMTELVPRWLTNGRTGTLLKYELRGEKACGGTASTCFILAGRHDRGTVELGVDTKTFALRTYGAHYTIVRSRVEAIESLEKLRGESRKRVPDDFVERMTAPLDVEESLVLDPVFDGPIAATTFDATP